MIKDNCMITGSKKILSSREIILAFLLYFLLIPAVLVGIYLMSNELKDVLALYPKSPTFISVWGSNFLHITLPHLTENLAYYFLIISFIFVFDMKTNKRMLFINFPLIFFILPIVSSLSTIAVFSYFDVNIPAEGFSAVVAGLLGYLPFSFFKFVKTYYKVDLESSLRQLLFPILLLNLVVIPIAYGSYMLLQSVFITALIIALLIIYVSHFKDVKSDYLKIFQLVRSKKLFTSSALSISIILIYCGSIFLYPQSLVIKGSVVNIVAHYVGYIFGFIVPPCVSIVSNKRKPLI